MNILKKFTIRNLRLNRKRTIVTIIGIMLSTSLICGVMGLVSSFQQTLINEVKESVGTYHTRFFDVPSDELKYIEDNVKVESYFLTHRIGFAKLEGSKNKYKPYLCVDEYDENALLNNGVILTEGRLPKNSSELVISEHIKDNARVRFNIGDKITLNVGERVTNDGYKASRTQNYDLEDPESIENAIQKTYTVVGIMERPDYSIEGYSFPGYTVITYMDKVGDNADISVMYKNPREYKTNNNAINPDDKYEKLVNAELLRYLGILGSETMRTVIGIATVVMVIIVVSSVFVIRNSFSISVAEKNKQYGMLSSIGATKKQIKKSVIFEGMVIGLIAVPLGIICGVVAIVILLQIVNYLLADNLGRFKFIYNLPAIPMLIAVAISFLTIYLSCLIPARRASKVSPIEAIRGNNDIKIKPNKLKVPRYISKLFGIGGVIASKNLKRNKRKYRTTVISIVISISIFISLFSFIYYGKIVSGVYYTEMKYNMAIFLSNVNYSQSKKSLDELAKLVNTNDMAYFYSDEAKMNLKYCSDYTKGKLSVNEEEPYITVFAFNNEYFKKFLKEIGVPENDYKSGIILVDDFIEEDESGKKKFYSIYDIKSGDIIDLEIPGKTGNQVKVLKKTDKRPMGLEKSYSETGMLLVSIDFIDNINEYEDLRMYVNSNNPTYLENSLNDFIENDDTYMDMTVINYEKWSENENRMVLVISIFLYGFITVITLIGVTNIFNTITTNMILRSKEFAMLKSVGMTTNEFNKMIRLENIMYGVKALLMGVPIGILGSYFIYSSYASSVDAGYVLPLKAILICAVFVFVIVGITMRYALNKINKQNIIDTIRNDNI